MLFTLGSRTHFLRNFLTEGGSACRRPALLIVVLSILSAIAFGAAPFFLSVWVSLLAQSPPAIGWMRYFSFYLLAYALAFAGRDVQWLFYTRIESAVFSSVTRSLTLRSVDTNNASNGIGLLTQTLQGSIIVVL